MAKFDYLALLRIGWRFGRVFLGVFLVQVGTGLNTIENFNALKALLIAAASAALVALGKTIREYFKANKHSLYKSLIRYLPF